MLSTRTYKKLVAPLAALALLAGCTTATPYQPLGATNVRGGFADQPLDATHFRVSFYGNSLTSRQQVENYLLYRAAELTAQRGSTCFTIVNHAADRNTTVQVNPYGPYGYGGGFYGGGWSPYWRMHGPFGWYNYDPFGGDPFFPGQYDINTIDEYQAMADIALGNTCVAGPGTFNAQQVMANLAPYIVYPRPR
jgi:hypothetical protein